MNPLISKCEIKVCYVGDEPNRNRSIITKEVATELANSLPGSPIVGYYNEEKKDFEEHNRVIDISNGKFELKDTTRPYGFVSTDAKVWFQWFEDDGVRHQYLMTEGYLWTGQYPECQRVIERGNNQSMELDQNHLDAFWSKDINGKPEFFIINEAIMSKLCILGEDVEPCFEGASISSVQFSFDDNFRETWAEMVNQMREILNEGGAPVFKYTVNLNSDKTAIENYLTNLEDKYSLVECYNEEDINFAVLQKDNDYFRMNYSMVEDNFSADEPTLIEYSRERGFERVVVTECVETTSCVWDDEGHEVEETSRVVSEKVTTVSGPVEPIEEVEDSPVEVAYTENNVDEETAIVEEPAAAVEYEAEVEEVSDAENEDSIEQPVADEVIEEKVEAQIEEEQVENFAMNNDNSELAELQDKYSKIEEDYNSSLGLITELKTSNENLQNQYNALQAEYSALQEVNAELEGRINALNEFKLSVEREKKTELIGKFYMLNDADKQDVIENIDKYSLDDIEAKLCVACYRNHVSFDNAENKATDNFVAVPTVYTLGNPSDDGEDLTEPDWAKAVRATQKKLNNYIL